MLLNDELPNHDHASTSLKTLLLVFALVLVGVLGYLVYQQNTAPDETSDSIVPKKTANTNPPETTKTPATTSITAADENLVACGDTAAYGFDLTFGAKWTGHKVKQILQADMDPQPGYAVVTCYFEMPTTSTEDTWVNADSTHDAKYASAFAVSVYTPAQWTLSQQEANIPTELGHNASYYWGWSQAQALPDDLTAVYADSKNVVATFKIAD